MLKKAGIVAAAATAGVLAFSPMAFAHDHDNDGNSQRGLVNVQNTNASVPVQVCNNSVAEGTVGVLAKKQKNEDSHKGKCKLHNSVEN